MLDNIEFSSPNLKYESPQEFVTPLDQLYQQYILDSQRKQPHGIELQDYIFHPVGSIV